MSQLTETVRNIRQQLKVMPDHGLAGEIVQGIADGEISVARVNSLISDGVEKINNRHWHTLLAPSLTDEWREYITAHTLTFALDVNEIKVPLGHQTGQQLTALVQEQLPSKTRPKDWVYRYFDNQGSNTMSTGWCLNRIHEYGIDYEFTKTSLYWTKRGGIWGFGTIFDAKTVVGVLPYYDPEGLIHKGVCRTDTCANSFVGLVEAGITLRDQLVKAGVFLIHT